MLALSLTAPAASPDREAVGTIRHRQRLWLAPKRPKAVLVLRSALRWTGGHELRGLLPQPAAPRDKQGSRLMVANWQRDYGCVTPHTRWESTTTNCNWACLIRYSSQGKPLLSRRRVRSKVQVGPAYAIPRAGGLFKVWRVHARQAKGRMGERIASTVGAGCILIRKLLGQACLQVLPVVDFNPFAGSPCFCKLP